MGMELPFLLLKCGTLFSIIGSSRISREARHGTFAGNGRYSAWRVLPDFRPLSSLPNVERDWIAMIGQRLRNQIAEPMRNVALLALAAFALAMLSLLVAIGGRINAN